MILVTHNQSAKVLQPSKQTFDFPSTSVSPQYSAVLRRRLDAIILMWRDHFDTSLFGQLLVQFIRVVGSVANKFFRHLIDHSCIQRLVDQRYFMWASAACVHGERNTLSVDNAHDFGAFAAFGLADPEAPFFADTNVASTKPSLRSMPPRSRRSWARAVRTILNTPFLDHCWNRLWHVLFGGYLSGKSFQGAPVLRIHKMPSSTCLCSTQGRPCSPGPLRDGGRYLEIRFHCSSVISISG